MRFKAGVKLGNVSPQIVLAILVAQEVYSRFDYDFVVTSITEGVHGKDSLHYSGNAVDLRTKNAGIGLVQAEMIAKSIREQLTPDFDVVVEPDHIHLEWDPK
jgi:predicted Rdx family selenoprotein